MDSISYSNFKRVDPRVTSLSLSYVNIYARRVAFNLVTVSDLEYPEYVELLLDDERGIFAIAAVPEKTPTSIEFATQERLEKIRRPKSLKRIEIKNEALAKVIRETMKWDNPKQTFRAYGERYLDEHVVMFDLTAAEIATKGKRKTASAPDIWKLYKNIDDPIKKLQPLLLLPSKEILENERKDEEERQKKPFETGEKPVIVDTEFVEIEAV